MMNELEKLIDEWASCKFGYGSPAYAKAKSERLDQISRLMDQPMNYSIEDIGIGVCRNGESKGSMLAFYKTRDDALSDQNRIMTIEFGTISKLLQWTQLHHQLARTIHSALN